MDFDSCNNNDMIEEWFQKTCAMHSIWIGNMLACLASIETDSNLHFQSTIRSVKALWRFFSKIENLNKWKKRKNKTTSDDAMILKLHKKYIADDN